MPEIKTSLDNTGGTGGGHPSAPHAHPTQRLAHSLAYLAVLSALFLAFNYTYPLFKHYRLRTQGGLAAQDTLLLSPYGKTEYLKQNAGRFDLIFFGDSRTYIGVAPEIISPILNRRTFNFASTAHWIQTQYPQLEQIIPALKGKTVVWGIGHLNFTLYEQKSDLVNDVYPLSPTDSSLYLSLGFRPADISTNLGMYFLDPGIAAFQSDKIKASYKGLLSRNAWTAPGAPQAGAASGPEWTAALNAAQLEAQKQRPLVFMEKTEDGARKRNVVYTIYKRTGQEEYWELDPAYLRDSQLYFERRIKPINKFTPDKRLESLFTAMLDRFKSAGIRLIVVELRDAPYNYKIPSNIRAYNEYMATIETKVRSRGFTYLKPDFSQYTDKDYFDDCHFNAPAARIWSRQLANLLKAELSRTSTAQTTHTKAPPHAL